MQSELEKLKQLTEALTSNGYLTDQANAWQFAFDAVDELICITNQNLNIKFMNKEILKRLSIEDNNYLNEKLNVFFDEDVKVITKEATIDRTDIMNYGECKLGMLDGWFDIRRSSIKDNLQKHIGYIFILVDVTEKRHIQKTLSDNNKLLLGVLDAIPDILSVQDVDHNILICNAMAQKMLDIGSIEHKKCYQLLGREDNCENCPTMRCKLSKLPEKSERYIEKLEGWYDCRSYPILDESGVVIKVIEHLRSINKENS